MWGEGQGAHLLQHYQEDRRPFISTTSGDSILAKVLSVNLLTAHHTRNSPVRIKMPSADLPPRAEFEILRRPQYANALDALSVEMAEVAPVTGQQEVGFAVNRREQDRPIL